MTSRELSDRGQDRASTRVLITGAAGFLGSHVARVLHDAQLTVIGADRAPIGEETGCTTRVEFDFLTGDIDALLTAQQPAAVVHLAGAASVPNSIADPAADFQGSIALTQRLLEAIRRTRFGIRVIYFSSAAVYGDPAILPIDEQAALRPLSPYGFHKAMTEMLLREYAQLHSVPACSLRVFSAYGPGLRRQLLWDVLQKARSSSQVVLNGTGLESRDFVHVHDVARAALQVLRYGEFDGSAYNVGSGVETTVALVADSVMQTAGVAGQPIFSGQTRAGDPLRWRADISRLHAIGWSPEIAFAEGVAEYVRWADTE